MRKMVFAEALLPEGWRRDVRVEIDAEGRIAAVTPDAEPGRLVALPGLPNLHSHAFQRGMAGLTEHAGDSEDSFWTWRELMYRFLAHLTPDDVEAIATLAYAEIDMATGQCMLVQAGHPHPLILRKDGQIEMVGNGGLPIGLIEGASYQRITFRLAPGDRLILASDGFTECPDPAQQELGDEGLANILATHAPLSSPQLLEAMIWALSRHAGTPDFPDDVSSLIFDYRGA